MPTQHALTSRLIHTLQRFNQIDPKMQISTILVFLEIARADSAKTEISPKDLEQRIGLQSGTLTRNMYYWENGHADVSGSHGMIEIKINPNDRRRRTLSLTPKGQTFARQVLGVLEDAETERNQVSS